MTAVQTVINHGFAFSHPCSTCGGRADVYLNPAQPDFQIKILKQGGRTKIYRKGQLIAQTTPDSLELVLIQKGL